MSMKRQATAELNHENWDQEEPKDNDMSIFKTAPKDVLEKRVIRTGKRRFYAPSGDDTRKNVFSGFQGFTKPQTSAFEFLTNLTNGTKTTSNGSLLTSTDSSFTSPSPFGLKPPTPSSSLFQIPTIPLSSDTSPKPANIFGPAIKSSVFQTPTNTTSNVGSIFNSPKDSTTEPSSFRIPSTEPSSFRIPSTGNTTVTNNFLTPIKSDGSTVSNSTNIQNTSPIFGTVSINQSASPTTTLSNLKSTQSNSGGSPLKKTESIVTDFTSAGTQIKDTDLVKFYSKLASLNKAVTEWVKKHVEDTPLCILTPIFRDYEKYLKELQSKYGVENIENELESESQSKSTDSETKTSNTFESSKPLVSNLFSNHNNKNAGNHSLFDTKTDAKDTAATLVASKSSDISKTTSTNLPTFSFGTTSSNTNKSTTTSSLGANDSILNTSTTNDTTVTFTLFSKGPATAVSTPTTNTFSFNMNTPTTTTVNATPPTFSFGGKPNNSDSTPSFSFGIPSVTKTDDSNKNTLFSITSKPSTTVNVSAPTFSFENPISSSTATTTISTLAFNAKPITSISSPTPIGTTTNTTTTLVPSTFSFNSKSIGATTVSPFTINMSYSPSSTTSAPSTFSFAIKSPSRNQSTTAVTPFSFNMNTPISTVSESKAFSFGTGKPFTFNTENKTENSQQSKKEEDEEPPKNEFTPVVEENSVYDKRCKVYVKKDGSFVDKGVGTLYIKKVDDSGKHQLLVRANTNLGNILINLILSKNIPLQRLAKSDVMMGCVPTPDEKPHPIPVLIRVKTSEEADELLEALKKYS
ncbi:Nuclear pore complex protein Nup50 [Eumeta japonica]|uniref:Nuclear pore complex protein Nup50 n=1 Tax=Eumeta variegata TaxID=151549 RepID=A0A4C1SRM9_EUMVA|nr:Nuclear pore complex protein Nup50 [Eumeta japonica]